MPKISTVIAKPTKLCNADCGYCTAPPDGAIRWSLDDFREYFDKLAPHLAPNALFLWHGGEPMLMGPEFFRQCHAYAKSKVPGIQFAIQTNLLLYESSRWQDVFRDVMGGAVSTSFDIDIRHRTLKGSAQAYANRFRDRLDSLLDDGFTPMVIGTFDEACADRAVEFFDLAKSGMRRSFDIRLNYRYPAGRIGSAPPQIQPETYGCMLVRILNRWLSEDVDFLVAPLDQMLKKVAGIERGERCPWTNQCGGQFIGLEPNGDVFNCAEYADLNDPAFCFGNLRTHSLSELQSSVASRLIRRRRTSLPSNCLACPHYEVCGGGCSRDAVLFGKGMDGRFYYCESWRMVFDQIKAAVLAGRADRWIVALGGDPDIARQTVIAAQQQKQYEACV